MDRETHESESIDENFSPVSRTTGENSRNSVDGVVLDTLILPNSVRTSTINRDSGDLGSNIDDVGSSKELVEEQETGDGRVIAENSSNLVQGIVLETVIFRNSEESTSCSGENGDDGMKIDEMGSSDAVVEAQETYNCQRVGKRMNQIDQVLDTVILVNLDQTACARGENNEVEAKSDELGSSKAVVEMLKRKEPKVENESCLIDIKCAGGDEKRLNVNGNQERVCRICHLDSEQSLEAMGTGVGSSAVDLIHLGCGCKDELGIAHSHCAEAWFKLKGNRLCEICGQAAKNITGVGDFRFMEEWNEHRFIGSSNSSSERSGCWRGQPFCNFLMACLVIAFVLPWFFRVNMFQ